MSDIIHAGVFELTGISGVSLARKGEVLGLRLVFPQVSLGIFDGKDLPLSISAPPIEAPDLSYVAYQWQVPVTLEGIRKYAGYPRIGVNSPSIFNYEKGDAATVKVEWSFDGKTIQGRYTSDTPTRFALIVNGCFQPAVVTHADATCGSLKLGESEIKVRLQGKTEEPFLLDEYHQLDRAWNQLSFKKGTRFAAYPVTIGPDAPLLFSATLDEKASVPDVSKLDAARLTYEKNRMRNTGLSAGAAEAIASLTAYSRAYDPKRQCIQTTVNRTWGVVNSPGLVFGWDNFFMSYSAAWENPKLAVQSLEHIIGVYCENGISNGPTQRNLIIPSIYCRTIHLLGDWELARRTWSKMMEFMHFFFQHRDGNGDGLIELGAPFHENAVPGRIIQEAMDESGYDEISSYSSGFSEGRRGIPAPGVDFDWKSQCLTITTVCQNALFISACHAMEALAKKLGHTEDASWLRTESERVAKRMNELLYSKEQGIFRDRYWAGGFSPTKTMTLFFPLLANIADERGKKILHEMLTDPKQFWGENVIPTVSRDDPTYCDGIDRKGNYWRGNCWAPTTYMVYLSAKEAGWDSTVAEYAKRASAQFMEYWLKYTHAYENYPPEGKVDHDFLYVTMWGGRESHYVWSAMQVLCALEEIFGFELDGSLRFGNPYLSEQSSWKNFLYQGHRVEAEAGPERTRVLVDGLWEFSANVGVTVRHFDASKEGSYRFLVEAQREATISLTNVCEGVALLINGCAQAFERSGNGMVFKIAAGNSKIEIA